jgi:hypothetical protein
LFSNREGILHRRHRSRPSTTPGKHPLPRGAAPC